MLNVVVRTIKNGGKLSYPKISIRVSRRKCCIPMEAVQETSF